MGRRFLLAVLVATAAVAAEHAAPRIDVAEAAKLVAEKKAVVIDSRSAERYAMQHIPGAINVPLGTEAAYAPKLAKETRTIITYCTCHAEETALAAATNFEKAGIHDVRALKGGLGEWQKQGQALEP